jgi:hypothetical protein
MKRLWIPQAIAIVVVLWALNPGNPYGYYVLLRWVCCGVFAFLAFHAIALAMPGWSWTLGITALVYNPILPVHLSREIWSIVNIVTVGVAIMSIFRLRSQNEPPSKGEDK